MLNHIVIMGRLIRDPELRRTGSGTAVASFTVAVDRDYAQQGQEKEADFIDCVAWAQRGEFVGKYFTKGSMIVVSGRLQIRGWTDKDGNKRRSAEVNADNCYFGESKGRSEGRQTAQGGAGTAAIPTDSNPAVSAAICLPPTGTRTSRTSTTACSATPSWIFEVTHDSHIFHPRKAQGQGQAEVFQRQGLHGR